MACLLDPSHDLQRLAQTIFKIHNTHHVASFSPLSFPLPALTMHCRPTIVNYEARPRFPDHLAQNWNVRALSSRGRAKQESKCQSRFASFFIHFLFISFTICLLRKWISRPSIFISWLLSFSCWRPFDIISGIFFSSRDLDISQISI